MVKIALVFIVTAMFWAAGYIVGNTPSLHGEIAIVVTAIVAIFSAVIMGCLANSPLYAVMALLNLVLGLTATSVASLPHAIPVFTILPHFFALTVAVLSARQMKEDIDQDNIPVLYP